MAKTAEAKSQRRRIMLQPCGLGWRNEKPQPSSQPAASWRRRNLAALASAAGWRLMAAIEASASNEMA
jgi:hypothetical protein